MSNQIIWVYGPSAVGKETFIKYLVEEKPLKLLDQFGLSNSQLLICADSLNWVVKKNNDGNAIKRKYLDKVIENISKNNQNSAIIVKGQDLDFEYGIPTKIKRSLPTDKHRVFYLKTEFEILFSRFVEKVWWNKDMTKNVCIEWANSQIKYLLDIEKNGFEVVVIDSSNIRYKISNINFNEIKY